MSAKHVFGQLVVWMAFSAPLAHANRFKSSANGNSRHIASAKELFTESGLNLNTLAAFMRGRDLSAQLGILFPGGRIAEFQQTVGSDIVDHSAFAVHPKQLDKVLATNARDFRQLDRRIVTHPVSKNQTEAIILALEDAENVSYNVELIIPVANDNLYKFIEERPNQAHHLAIRVLKMMQAMDRVRSNLIDQVPYEGAMGHEVAFVKPKAYGFLSELVAVHTSH